jgi:signal transduction histidine kinase
MSNVMAPPPRRSGTQVQERRDYYAADIPEPRWPPEATVTFLPYIMLMFAFMLTAIFESSQNRSLLINTGLCGIAAAWMLWMFTLHPGWRQRQTVMSIFFTGLIVIMFVLVIRASWFGFFTLTSYFYALKLLRWPWRLAGVACTAIMAAISETWGIPKTNAIGILIFVSVAVVSVAGACGFTYFIWNSGVQAERRRQAVEELSEANRKLEAALAENAGLHVQLLTQAREAGVLDERHRIAREIHDTLAQGLTGIITQLQAAEQAGMEPASWRKHVKAATTLARESLSEARRSLHALRPESLEVGRLSDALADVAERWSVLHGVSVQVTTTGTVRLVSQEAEFVLLRTAQEALANVAKHARATRVGLTLSYMPGEVALDVRDDGSGFDPAGLGAEGAEPVSGGPAGGGFGLIAMRQRIASLAGTLQVESEPGGGTAISARVPDVPGLAADPFAAAAPVKVRA